MTSESPWAVSAQQFQQIFGQSWSQALQSFQNLNIGAQVPAAAPLKLSQTKLQSLQQQYLKEAQELWAQGLKGIPEVKDKRFVLTLKFTVVSGFLPCMTVAVNL